MSKQAIIIAVLAVTIAAFGGAVYWSQNKDNDAKSINDSIMHYYQKPEPEKVPDMLHKAAKMGLLDRDDTKYIFATYLGELMRRNPDKVDAWVASMSDFTESQKRLLMAALWQANLPQATEQLKKMASTLTGDDKKFFDQLLEKPATPLETKPITAPGQLDLLWACFFASGDTKYVSRIVDALAMENESGTQNILIGSAAKFSLTANAKEHETVMRFLKQAEEARPKESRKLREIIITASRNKERD